MIFFYCSVTPLGWNRRFTEQSTYAPQQSPVTVGPRVRRLNVEELMQRQTVLVLFGGTVYLLRFERVDNLGAYSIRSETGLLISSDYVNFRPRLKSLLPFCAGRVGFCVFSSGQS